MLLKKHELYDIIVNKYFNSLFKVIGKEDIYEKAI